MLSVLQFFRLSLFFFFFQREANFSQPRQGGLTEIALPLHVRYRQFTVSVKNWMGRRQHTHLVTCWRISKGIYSQNNRIRHYIENKCMISTTSKLEYIFINSLCQHCTGHLPCRGPNCRGPIHKVDTATSF